MEHLIHTPLQIALVNVFMAVVGWAIWIFGQFVIEKDDYDDRDEEFPFKKYMKKHWENWVFAAMFILVVLGGANFMGAVNTFNDTQLEWNNGFYLLPGPLSQWVISKIRAYNKKAKQQ